jgi:hypothetical protein
MFNFVKFVAKVKDMTKKFFSPLSFDGLFGSGIGDPGSGMGKNQDPGSGINIPDLQYCSFVYAILTSFSCLPLCAVLLIWFSINFYPLI